jgi:hypothetical protein
VSGDRHSEELGLSAVTLVHENGKITWANVPRQPIPKLDDLDLWVGRQLNHEKMPAKYLYEAPQGELTTSIDGYPEGLLAIPGDNGYLRMIVPRYQIKALVLQCHEDINRKSHVKVLYILRSLFYLPGMSKRIEKICTACRTCIKSSVRRRHLKAKFDQNAPPYFHNATTTRLRN